MVNHLIYYTLTHTIAVCKQARVASSQYVNFEVTILNSHQTADKPCHSHSLSSDSFCLHDKCVGRSPIAQENSEIEGCAI